MNTRKNSRLIVIDGLDGSGKTVQTDLLEQGLAAASIPVKTLSFPNYEERSSSLIQMYLSGEFGSHPEDVGAYAASTFYAVDRYASYKKYWKYYIEQGYTLICNRYTTSNIIHQMGKLERCCWDEYIAWSSDFEYGKLGLPEPDLVLYLDMDPDVSKKLISGRYHGDESKRDIHEQDFSYLLSCRDCALYAAEKLHWRVIRCDDGTSPFSIQDISKEILRQCRSLFDEIPRQ